MKVREASTSSAVRKLEARDRPPSRKRLVIPRSPRVRRAAVTRSAGVAPPIVVEDLGARVAQGLGGGTRPRQGETTTSTERGVERREELGVQRQARLRVEDDAKRLAGVGDALGTGGEQRVVGEGGADADRDRVGFGPPGVDEGAAALAGDPGVGPRRGRGLAVERDRQLQRHQRQAGAGVLAERLVEPARGGGLGAGGEDDLDAAVAEDLPGRGRRPSRSGPRRRSRRGRPRPRGSPRRRAAGARGGRTAPASRTSSPRPDPRRGRRRRPAQPALHGGRRAGRGSPRR